MYILTNGSLYYTRGNTSKIFKTDNINRAFKFTVEGKAKAELTRASKKLSGFRVCEINETDLSQDICRRVKFTSNMRKFVYKQSQGHCCLCGKFIDYEDFTVDHIIPLAKGGTNDIDNLQCACNICNKIKTDVLPNEFMDKITEMIIYNMNSKYNKIIGRKMFKMLITANVHRVLNKQKG